jgi:hypothetical protein
MWQAAQGSAEYRNADRGKRQEHNPSQWHTNGSEMAVSFWGACLEVRVNSSQELSKNIAS